MPALPRSSAHPTVHNTPCLGQQLFICAGPSERETRRQPAFLKSSRHPSERGGYGCERSIFRHCLCQRFVKRRGDLRIHSKTGTTQFYLLCPQGKPQFTASCPPFRWKFQSLINQGRQKVIEATNALKALPRESLEDVIAQVVSSASWVLTVAKVPVPELSSRTTVEGKPVPHGESGPVLRSGSSRHSGDGDQAQRERVQGRPQPAAGGKTSLATQA